MDPKKPRNLAELLSSGELGQLADRARTRRATTAKIKALLPPEEAAHVVSAVPNSDGELVVVMDSAVWAARVRYRQESLGAKQLRVRVVPRNTEESSG
jgi:hypothetical protein